MLTHAITADPVLEFASDVRAGLTLDGQKELPSKYLYDDVGSALFEVISVLPQYGLTRADERLLRRHASEIADNVPKHVAVAELGSGSGKKTRWILKALCRRQHISYFPIRGLANWQTQTSSENLHHHAGERLVGLAKGELSRREPSGSSRRR